MYETMYEKDNYHIYDQRFWHYPIPESYDIIDFPFTPNDNGDITFDGKNPISDVCINRLANLTKPDSDIMNRYTNYLKNEAVYATWPIDLLWFVNNGKVDRKGNLPARYCANKNVREYTWNKGGLVHRTNGPAFILYGYKSGVEKMYTQWYFNGEELSSEFYAWANNNKIDIDNISEEDEYLIKMKWEKC